MLWFSVLVNYRIDPAQPASRNSHMTRMLATYAAIKLSLPFSPYVISLYIYIHNVHTQRVSYMHYIHADTTPTCLCMDACLSTYLSVVFM